MVARYYKIVIDMNFKKTCGYFIALFPITSFLGIWFYYSVLSPMPSPPPNITLRGSEIILPVLLGAVLAIFWIVRGVFAGREVRQFSFIWAGISALPPIIFWVVIPALR